MTAITVLAGWSASVSDDHGPRAYRRARLAVLDTLACMLAGADDEAAVRARRAVAAWGAGASTVVGTDAHAAAPWAALVNGTAAHALDFDDYDLPTSGHPSAVLVPALLALAEERGASGRALLDAYLVGLEVMTRIGEAVNMSHYHLGWHATATVGALGAAAACARLTGLDAEETAAALSLATSMAGGFKSQIGTMAKPLHAGLAAKAGVLAAGLAASGTSASRDVLDGTWSFMTLLAGPESRGFDAPLKKLGGPLGIEEYGLYVKPYPCCAYIHRSVDAVLGLRRSHGLDGADIAAVTARIPGRNAEILMYPAPQTPMEARFSLEYCAAVAAVTGGLGVADFAPAAIRRPEIRDFLPRVAVERHPVGPRSSDLDDREPAVVTLRLRDGRRLGQTVDHARGSPERPLSEAEVAEKFRACAQGVLDPRAATAVEGLIAGLEDLPRIGDLTRHLAACGGPAI